jgi:hypothetical protein
MDPTRIHLLACDVFQDEIAALAGVATAFAGTTWLEMGLHDRPDVLRQEILRAIARIEQQPAIDTIVLAYALCGNGLLDLGAQRCRLVLPRAHDCISIMLGSVPRHQAVLRAYPGTYFYSPGWIRGRRVPGPDRDAWLREKFAQRHTDADMIDDLVEADRETFAHHNRAAYVDSTGDARAETYCRRCAHHLGWSFARLPGDATWLRDLLTGPWDDAGRFLVVPPGWRTARGDDATIVTAVPAKPQ